MDLWNPLPQLEAAFHRRNLPFSRESSESPNSAEESRSDNNAQSLSASLVESLPLSYHNHILLGSNLWYLQKPLRPRDVGKHRLVLVQGTRHGRLCGLRLSLQSEIRGGRQASLRGLPTAYDTHFRPFGTHTPTPTQTAVNAGGAKDGEFPATNASEGGTFFFSIEVTGVNHQSSRVEKWQIVTQSYEVYAQWMQALLFARLQSDVLRASGEYDKLRELARKMLNSDYHSKNTNNNNAGGGNNGYLSDENNAHTKNNNNNNMNSGNININNSNNAAAAVVNTNDNTANNTTTAAAATTAAAMSVNNNNNNAGLAVRKHYAGFRIYEKSFVGVRAVRWLMREKQCTMLQALAIGNRLLNAGLIMHVNHEHLFYPRNLLYRFGDDVLNDTHIHNNNNNNSNVNANSKGSVAERETHTQSPSQTVPPSLTNPDNKEKEKENKGPKSSLSKAFQAALHRMPSSLTHTFSHTQRNNNSTNTATVAVSVEAVTDPHIITSSPLSHTNTVTETLRDPQRGITAPTVCDAFSLSLTDAETLLHTITQHEELLVHAREQRLQKAQLLQILAFLFTLCWLCVDTHSHSHTAANEANTVVDANSVSAPQSSPTHSVWSLLSSLFFLSALALIARSLYADHAREDSLRHREETLLAVRERVCESLAALRAREKDLCRDAQKNIQPTLRAHEAPICAEESPSESEEGEGEEDSELDDLSSEDDLSYAEEVGEGEGEEEEDAFDVNSSLAPVAAGAPVTGIAEHAFPHTLPPHNGHSPRTPSNRRRGESEDLFLDDISELSLDTYTVPNHTRKDALKSPTRKLLSQHNQPELWPNFPILIKRAAGSLPQSLRYEQTKALLQPLRVHKPGPPEVSVIDIESDLFVGKAYLVFNHLRDTDPMQFKDKKRHSQAVIQGRFKVPVPFSKVYTGQAYDEPTQHLPIQWLVKGLGRVQPGFKSFLTGDKPYFLSPLMATSQHVVISRPGEEPSVTSLNLSDDLRLLGTQFQDMPSKKRKIYFSKRRNLIKHSFETDLVYTFDIYQNIFNFSTFQLSMGFLKYDLVKILGTCPIQIMSVLWDPIENSGVPPETWRFLFNFEVFHHHSIPADLLVTSASASVSTSALSPAENREREREHPVINSITAPGNAKDEDAKIESIYGHAKGGEHEMMNNPFREREREKERERIEAVHGYSDEEDMRESVSSMDKDGDAAIAELSSPEKNTKNKEKKKGRQLSFFKRPSLSGNNNINNNNNTANDALLSADAEKEQDSSPAGNKRKTWLGRMTSHA